MKQESLKFSGRASNPATKKFSPAQIAAQRLFAERARAGTLGKTVKRKAAAKRKTNPVTETLIYGLAPGETRDYMEELMYAGGQKLTQAQIDKVFKAASDAGYHSFRVAGFDPTMKPDFAAAVRRKRNPDKAKPRAYVKRASQATGAPPSKRLVTRRKKALTAPAGYFPNPYTMGKSKEKANFPFCVETKATENWSTKACFKTMQPAKEYAVALSKQYPNLAIRVMHYAGGAM